MTSTFISILHTHSYLGLFKILDTFVREKVAHTLHIKLVQRLSAKNLRHCVEEVASVGQFAGLLHHRLQPP